MGVFMGTDMRIEMRVHMGIDMGIGMHIYMHIYMCKDMHIDMSIGMRIDIHYACAACRWNVLCQEYRHGLHSWTGHAVDSAKIVRTGHKTKSTSQAVIPTTRAELCLRSWLAVGSWPSCRHIPEMVSTGEGLLFSISHCKGRGIV